MARAVNCAYHNWVGLSGPIRCPIAGGCGKHGRQAVSGTGCDWVCGRRVWWR